MEEARQFVQSESWRELRDDAGRLYARFNAVTLLLEVSYHRQRVIFDLREYLEIVPGLEIAKELE